MPGKHEMHELDVRKENLRVKMEKHSRSWCGCRVLTAKGLFTPRLAALALAKFYCFSNPFGNDSTLFSAFIKKLYQRKVLLQERSVLTPALCVGQRPSHIDDESQLQTLSSRGSATRMNPGKFTNQTTVTKILNTDDCHPGVTRWSRPWISASRRSHSRKLYNVGSDTPTTCMVCWAAV